MSQAQLIAGESRDPKIGDVYESKLSSIYQIIFVDKQIVLLRDQQESKSGENYHRIEKRSDFEMMIDADQMKLQPDSEIDLTGNVTIDWSQVDLIGAKTSENLHDAGYTTRSDIQLADDDELLAINGLGQKGLSNLRRFA